MEATALGVEVMEVAVSAGAERAAAAPGEVDSGLEAKAKAVEGRAAAVKAMAVEGRAAEVKAAVCQEMVGAAMAPEAREGAAAAAAAVQAAMVAAAMQSHRTRESPRGQGREQVQPAEQLRNCQQFHRNQR